MWSRSARTLCSSPAGARCSAPGSEWPTGSPRGPRCASLRAWCTTTSQGSTKAPGESAATGRTSRPSASESSPSRHLPIRGRRSLPKIRSSGSPMFRPRRRSIRSGGSSIRSSSRPTPCSGTSAFSTSSCATPLWRQTMSGRGTATFRWAAAATPRSRRDPEIRGIGCASPTCVRRTSKSRSAAAATTACSCR